MIVTRRDSERGSVSVLILAIMVVAAVVMFEVARAGAGAGAAARADTAADAAAIAAAIALARTEGVPAAVNAAREASAQNGADLRECDCTGDHAEVVVVADGATGRARAEVRLACGLGVHCGREGETHRIADASTPSR